MSKEENNIYDSFSGLDSDDDLIDVDEMQDVPSIADVPGIGRNPLAPRPMQPQPRPQRLIVFPRVPDDSQSSTSESLPLTQPYSPPGSPLYLSQSGGVAAGDSPVPLRRANAFYGELPGNYINDLDAEMQLSQSSSGSSQSQSAISPDNFRSDSPREKSPDRGRL